MLPALVGMSGAVYWIGATLLGVGFIAHAWKLKFNPTEKSAIETFKFSIYHLMLLFVLLLVDHYLAF
jgi:protoheme IX farnesyltransferase